MGPQLLTDLITIYKNPIQDLQNVHLQYGIKFFQVDTGHVVTKQELHLARPGAITLDVSAYPPLTYDWRKEGQKLEFPMVGKTLDPYTGSISIDNVQESDEGNYTCTVKFGTADTVEIEVTTIGKFFHCLFTEMLSILTTILV